MDEELEEIHGIYQTLMFICPNCKEGISTDVNSHEDIVCENCGYWIYMFRGWDKRFLDTLDLLPNDMFSEYKIIEE